MGEEAFGGDAIHECGGGERMEDLQSGKKKKKKKEGVLECQRGERERE